MCSKASSENGKRISVVTGHYGSGKTEFALQYALSLAEQGVKTAVVDLDVANPYFRSRQRQELLATHGIDVYSNVYGNLDITADMPAITAAVRAPLENPEVRTIVDAGGDAAGARVLAQFRKYLARPDCEILCVVNANRPETQSPDGALFHIRSIETELSLPVSGLISNTHMLRETSAYDILKGVKLCRELSGFLGIPLRYALCPRELAPGVTAALSGAEPGGKEQLSLLVFDELQMRESWLDAPVRPAGKSLFRE